MKHNILEDAERMLPLLTQWRQHIHEHAEISFKEFGTRDFICSVLDSYHIPYRHVATTGVLATITGRAVGDTPATVVLRADIDALPIDEGADVPFACTTGAMHACGHDMHTAALLGALAALAVLDGYADEFSGTVLGLFQPGEEMWPGGASVVLGEGVFDGVDPVAFIGSHVSPELKVGQIGVRSGTFMASSDEISITVQGRGGHSAQPHLLHDPVLAASAVVVALQQIVSRRNDPMNPMVLSFGRFVADGATNIIPDSVELNGTLRTMNQEWRRAAHSLIHEVAKSTAASYSTVAEVNIRPGYPCVENNEALTNLTRRVAGAIIGPNSVIDIPQRMTSEDFGFYSGRYPSVFFRWGVDSEVPLHNSLFLPDKRALPYGTAMLTALALESLCGK